MEFAHTPVMLRECLDALAIKPGGVYLDGTAGGGGHSAEIAKKLTIGKLIALDRDPDAVKAATKALQGLPAQVMHANFRQAKSALNELGVEWLDGALLDLGVSSHQLDTAERGFSYLADAPLDMRMSQNGRTAAELVNTLSRQELADIFRKYGEEPYAWQIAGRIEKERQQTAIKSTTQLAEIVAACVPPAVRRKSKNPARRVFQALRISTNAELDALNEGLCEIFEMLNTAGRFAIITFHSLEDRIVKLKFREWCTACTCPPELPICVCGGKAKAKNVEKPPIVATKEERQQNRRSRSAKLRVIEKT